LDHISNISILNPLELKNKNMKLNVSNHYVSDVRVCGRKCDGIINTKTEIND
jgi:hypothetical protein